MSALLALDEAIDFLRSYKSAHIHADKSAIQNAYIAHFNPNQARSVFVGNGYSMRFCEAKTGSFSNTVLSLSALRSHDSNPFVVIVVCEFSIDFLLANSTFLRKISHSSHSLREDNVKGSFNGSDILSEYEHIPNAPENFQLLFALHSAFSWAENLERLVEATNSIVARDGRFLPSTTQRETILQAPARAAGILRSPLFIEIEKALCSTVLTRQADILTAARVDNVNIRGNLIEQIITGGVNTHELGDIIRPFTNGELRIDLKTKLLDRASAPKAYNVDKMLRFLAEPGSVFAVFLIGVDTVGGVVSARLIPALDKLLIGATVVQHHWAGRASRGVTQMSGRFHGLFESDYKPHVDLESFAVWLNRFGIPKAADF